MLFIPCQFPDEIHPPQLIQVSVVREIVSRVYLKLHLPPVGLQVVVCLADVLVDVLRQCPHIFLHRIVQRHVIACPLGEFSAAHVPEQLGKERTLRHIGQTEMAS